MANGDGLRLGVPIKPVLRHNDVYEILSEVYGLNCVLVKELNGYDDNNFYVKVDQILENKYIQSVNEQGYTLKIVNSLDSEKPQLFDAQNQVLTYLGKTGILCPQPVRSISGKYCILKNLSSGKHIVRLLEFIDGSILHEVPCSKDLFYQAGKYVAQLNEALKTFHHPAYDQNQSIWHLKSVPQLTEFLYVIRDESRKRIVESVIEEFTFKILPACEILKKGFIHGDFNEQNILVEKKGDSWCIKGILDFGDSHVDCYIFELAIAMTYMMIQGRDIDVGGYVLAGYNSVRRLSSGEIDLLRTSIAGRLCQSLVLGAYSNLQNPENSYVLTTAEHGWALLEELWEIPENKLLQRWINIVESYKVT